MTLTAKTDLRCPKSTPHQGRNTLPVVVTHALVPVFPHERARFCPNATLTDVLALASSPPSAPPAAFDVAPFDSVLHAAFSPLPHDRATSSSAYPRPLYPGRLAQTTDANPGASVFAGQSIHELVPSNRLNLPGTHVAQLNMSPSYPNVHSHSKRPGTETELFGHDTQVLTLSACTAVEYVFAAHSEHETLLTSLLYVPGAHDAQLLRPVPPKPALH
jgi:hypothetical protein